MNFDEDDISAHTPETGSDELLSADHLRLPADANALVRLHAVRAWLTRRQRETQHEIGQSALNLQDLQSEVMTAAHLRRREQQLFNERLQHTQKQFQIAQERLQIYQEAEELLEECVNHTTVSDRLLVEYYLTLETLLQEALPDHETVSPRIDVLQDVLQRIEHVGASHEEE